MVASFQIGNDVSLLASVHARYLSLFQSFERKLERSL